MNVSMAIRCFLVGLSAASGVGPIFLLTLNRATLFGFSKGFATALGSALADSCYFALAMLGALNLIEQSKLSFLALEGVGAVALIIFGVMLFRGQRREVDPASLALNEHFLRTLFRAFLLTALNPFVLLFFMFMTLHILPAGISNTSYRDIAIGALLVGVGSLGLLCAIAGLGAFMGSALKREYIEKFSKITALIFVAIGIGIFVDFAARFWR